VKPDSQSESIPSDEVLQLIGALNTMKDALSNAAQQWKLRDDNGHVPDTPSYTALFQHATDAQNLSRDILQLTADFARSPHHTTRAGSTILNQHLGPAATLSSHAAAHFTQTAEYAVALARSTNPADRHFLAGEMVMDHGTARAFLRHASDSLRDAAKELNDHLGFQRSLATLTRQEGPPAPPPPRPGGRHH
jgi:hypothetical protein